MKAQKQVRSTTVPAAAMPTIRQDQKTSRGLPKFLLRSGTLAVLGAALTLASPEKVFAQQAQFTGTEMDGVRNGILYTTPEHQYTVKVSDLPPNTVARAAWQGYNAPGVYYWPMYNAGPYYCDTPDTFLHDDRELNVAFFSGVPAGQALPKATIQKSDFASHPVGVIVFDTAFIGVYIGCGILLLVRSVKAYKNGTIGCSDASFWPDWSESDSIESSWITNPHSGEYGPDGMPK